MLYALGAGIAHYLGKAIDWQTYLMGQFWVTSLQLGSHYLIEYYDTPPSDENPDRTRYLGGRGLLQKAEVPREIAIIAAATALTSTAVFTVILIQSNQMSVAALLFMALMFIGAVFYSVPPISLVTSGFGEIATSMIVGLLVPALGYQLQAGELHVYVAMSAFPLAVLHFAMMISFEFSVYINDLKAERGTILVRLGWERGMLIHNIAQLSAFLILGLATIFGLPARIALPAFLPLPLSLLQIWQFQRIAAGIKPNWRVITLNGVVTYSLMVYLLTLAFWTR